MPNFIFQTVWLFTIFFQTILPCKVIPYNMCTMDNQTQFCKYQDLNLNITHPYIEPTSEIPPDEVTHVDLGGSETPRKGSKIHILTNEFCDTFGNMEQLNAANLDLQVIQEGAFKNCHNMKILILEKNTLQEFNGMDFVTNTKLLYLDVSDNMIEEFDMTIFDHLLNLKAMDLSKNFLKVFDMKKIPMEVPLLKGLILRENELTTLDEKDIVIKFPGLEYLYFCPNTKMTPFRINQIVDYLEEKGIDTMRDTCPTNP